MTRDACPRCRAPLILDFEDGACCLMCGYRPRPAVLLGIPEEGKVSRRKPSHNNIRI